MTETKYAYNERTQAVHDKLAEAHGYLEKSDFNIGYDGSLTVSDEAKWWILVTIDSQNRCRLQITDLDNNPTLIWTWAISQLIWRIKIDLPNHPFRLDTVQFQDYADYGHYYDAQHRKCIDYINAVLLDLLNEYKHG